MLSVMIIPGAILWYSLTLLPAALVLSLATLLAVAWLYPPQLRAVRGPWRWGLPALRWLALLALAVSILKPVATRPKTAAESGTVLLLLDGSRSMGTKDAAGQPSGLVGLADAMGMLPPGVRSDAVVAIQGEADRVRNLAAEIVKVAGELDYAKLSGHGVTAAQERLEQTEGRIRSAAAALAQQYPGNAPLAKLSSRLTAMPSATDGARRESWLRDVRTDLDRGERLVAAQQSTADAGLFSSNIEVRHACEELAGLSRLELAERVLTQNGRGVLPQLGNDVPVAGYVVGETLSPLTLRGKDGSPVALDVWPTAARSDVTGGVRAALDQFKESAVQAVVLLSDGRQVGGDATVASGLSATGVPIFSVAMARPPFRDVAITRVSLPSSQFVDEPVHGRVDVYSSGMKGRSVPVRLKVDDTEQVKTVVLQDTLTTSVEFTLKLQRPGIRKLIVSIDGQPGELTAENNRVERWIKVLGDKVRVAVYAPSALRDIQYLCKLLLRTPWVEFDDTVLQPHAAGAIPAPEQILRCQVLVLSDVAATSLRAEQWDSIYRLVSERGGSVIIVPGESSLTDYAQNAMFSNLLPFRSAVKPVWRVWPGEEPQFHLVPSPEGELLDALRLDETAPLSRQKWRQLPGLHRYLAIPELKPSAEPLLVELESSNPVLICSRLGRGRVFFLGTDETWRWRQKVGERDQDRFWLQLIRYAAEEPYAARNGTVSLDSDTIQAEPNDPVRVRARVLAANDMPSQAAKQELRLFRNGRHLATRTMTTSSIGSGRYETTINDLDEGDYELELSGARLPLYVKPAAEAELANLSGDERLLRRLAESSGGAMFSIDHVDRLVPAIQQSRQAQPRIAERPLWDSPWLFLLVLGCFGVEWGMRKRFGLA